MTEKNDPADPAKPATAGENFAASKAHARQAADELRAAAEAKARELRDAAQAKAGEIRDAAQARAGEIRGRAEQAYGEARERARGWQADGEAYVRANPLKAALTCLGAGFILGLLIRR